jgi:hypothetical protein
MAERERESVRPSGSNKKHQQVSRLLPSERASLGQTGLATGRLAENGGAALADDDSLGVGEDGGDGEAAGALDVHEEGPGRRHEGLELVLAGLGGRVGVKEINGENHLGWFSGRDKMSKIDAS